MTVLSLEVFGISPSLILPISVHCLAAPSAKAPNPDVDEIVAVFYSFQGVDSAALCSGTVVVDTTSVRKLSSRNSKFKVVSTELDLLNQIVDVVVDLDPDIVVGWEIQAASWGYLHERGREYGMS
jgi:DNA polymerase zeta